MPKPNRLLSLSILMACCSSMAQADEQILFSTQVSTGLDSRSPSSTAIPINMNNSITKLTVGDFIQFPALDSKGSYRVEIEKVIRHSSSDVTLVGSVNEQGNPYRAIITIGQTGSYAKIATAAGDYRIELNNGQNWLWTPSTQDQFSSPSFIDDMLIPDRTPPLQKSDPDRITAELPNITIKGSSTNTETIDIMVLYTTALETRLAGTAAVNTRINHLIATSNQAYTDSQVNLRLRLVHAEATSYSNNANANDSLVALKENTGSFTTVPAIRTEYGADLVVLMQDFIPTDTHRSCGLAYRLGGFTIPGHMDADDKDWAFSVIYDGQQELSNGSYTFCPEHTLAHEVGHSLGAAHDRDHLGQNSTGLFTYSYGHDDSAGNNQRGTFATIMSYDQPSVSKFSNPDIDCNGSPCGLANSANNARGFNNIGSEVAAFFASVVPPDADQDGVDDDVDNCPANPNSNQADMDSDKLGDVCDADQDGDTIANINDNCPINPNSNQTNMDSDNLGDVCDPDQDGDGVANTADAFPSDRTEWADPDSDGIGSNADNCPTIHNDQADMDSDNLGDVCDPDQDGDGVANTTDTFPSDPTEWTDPDGDGIGSNTDNCPSKPNRGQVNTDGDQQGNACDDDDDNDGMSDRWEYQHGFNPLSAEIRNEGDFDDDGYSDLDEFKAGTNPRDPQDHIKAISSFYIDHKVSSDWRDITTGSAVAPVVLAGPPSLRDATPGVVRINDTGNGFEVQIQPWDYLLDPANSQYNPDHDPESVPFMVLEQGSHKMSDGSIWEVGTFQIRDSGQWQTVAFENVFAQSQLPHLFLTVQTYNGHDAVTVRAKNVSINDFQAALYEEEKKNTDENNGHTYETVGYLAIYSQTGSGEIVIDGKQVPYLVQQVDVSRNGTPVLNSILIAQEEQSKDDEIIHKLERYDILGIGSKLFAQEVSSAGGDPIAPRQKAAAFPGNIEWGTVTGVGTDWIDVPLSRNNYQRPVVVLDSSAPAPIRLRRALNGGFQVQTEGETGDQQIHYIVAEQGSHEIAGLKFEAGLVASSSDRVRAVNFSTGNFSNPAVFSSVMTTFGNGSVEAIATDVGTSGFDISMNAPGHRLEVLGWIAIDNGSTSLAHQGRKAIISDAPAPADNDSALADLLGSSGHFPIILRGDTDDDSKTSVFVAE